MSPCMGTHMTTFVRTVLLFFTVVAAVAAGQGDETTREIVKSYLEIHAQLAADRVEKLKPAANALASTAAALGADGAALAKAAAAVAAASDLASAREAFAPLSDAVIARVRADGSKEAAASLKVAYCPMVKKSWLQRDEAVKNPYYGAQMLTCGELKPVRQ